MSMTSFANLNPMPSLLAVHGLCPSFVNNNFENLGVVVKHATHNTGVLSWNPVYVTIKHHW